MTDEFSFDLVYRHNINRFVERRGVSVKLDTNALELLLEGHAATTCLQYLVSDLDEEHEYDDNKEVVEDADSSNDAVDDLESKVTTLSARSRT